MGFDPRITRIRLTDERLAQELAILEKRFKMTSAEFLLRFNSGELGDDLELIRWASLLSLQARTTSPEHTRA